MVIMEMFSRDPTREASKTGFSFQQNTVHTLADGPTGWLACWLGWAGLGWLAGLAGWAGLAGMDGWLAKGLLVSTVITTTISTITTTTATTTSGCECCDDDANV